MRLSFHIAILCGLFCANAQGQTIYPIDRAEMPAGSRFDLKVEFAGKPDLPSLKVTIDGIDAATVMGKPAELITAEEGQDQTAYWIRAATLPQGKHVVEASAGEASAKVTWDVYKTPARRARNVILFVGDGMSMAHRTAARILSKGIAQGKYNGDLAMDDMPSMALVSTAGSDSIITDSANAMSAFTTGHKTCVNAIGVYCARNKSALSHPKVEVISELVKRRQNMAVGVVTNTEIADATPAGMVAHNRARRDYNTIVKSFFDVKPDVIMGGGAPYFKPARDGGKRTDGENYIDKFKAEGYAFAGTSAELKTVASAGETRKLLGLFNDGNIDGALDQKFLKKGSVRKFPDQPDLVEETTAALDILSRAPNGFMLMVESGRIDKYSHSLDWERAVYDTIMLDNAVKAAKTFAADRDDTLIIVVADHAHPVSIIGTMDDARPGNTPRDRLATYADAKFPNYPAPNADGYPWLVDVSRRLALMFGAYPDHCYSGTPYLAGEFLPSDASADGKKAVANEKFCNPGTVRMFGNLPLETPGGVHSGDDVILTAMGPGADLLHGRLDNTKVFRVMATALGLAAD